MYNGQVVLVVVPARGGSKGIKLKNLREVGGISLVARAANVVAELGYVDRAIVSTDHAEIARAAQEAGLSAPFTRPESISGDYISDVQVLTHAVHAVEKIDGVIYPIIVMLQPTSPLRTAGHVTRTVSKLVAGGYDAVWTVTETDSKYHPWKQLTLGRDDELDYHDQRGANIIARQELPALYHRNGVAYAMTRKCIIEQGSIKGRRAAAIVIEDPVVNIDTEDDLLLAEFILEQLKRSM